MDGEQFTMEAKGTLVDVLIWKVDKIYVQK